MNISMNLTIDEIANLLLAVAAFKDNIIHKKILNAVMLGHNRNEYKYVFPDGTDSSVTINLEWSLTGEPKDTILSLLQNHQLISAIKTIRHFTTLGLKESKDIAEDIRNHLREIQS